MSDGSQLPGASAFESARPEADLEGRLVLEAMRGAMFGTRDKPVAVGRYELIERLGSGALGLVVAARDPELDRRVAIKLLPARVDSRKLLREARALARLSSPYVVAVLDVGTFEPEDIGTLFGGDPGDPAGTGVWLAMELVEGTPLDAWIKRGPHDWREVLEVFREAGTGLADAHDARIVHRDFKPANVILGNDKRVRVVDFGLARSPNLSFMTSADAAAAADDAALIRGLIGTPAYMSPEQHKGEPTDERADQFSFCVSMYEALYGDIPYPGPRYEDFMRDKNKGPPPMPSEPEVPLSIRRALTRGLDVDPGQRFDSMRALLAALAVGDEDKPKGSGRVVAAGLLAAGVAGAAYLALATRNDCVLPQADVANWDRATGALVSKISAAQAPYAKVAAFRVQEVLQQRQTSWSEARTAVCESAPMSPATEQCMVLSMRGIDAATEWLSRMTPDRIAFVEAVLSAVPDAASCADDAAPSPEDNAIKAVDLRHRTLVSRLQARSGDAEGGLAATKAAREAATAFGFGALMAEAALTQAEAAYLSADAAFARAAYADAYALGTESTHKRVVAGAIAGMLRVDAGGQDETWLGHAQEAREGLDDALAVELSLAEAAALASRGRHEAAIDAYGRARKLLDADPAAIPPPLVAELHGGLADALLANGRDDEANASAERARSLIESAFGPGHPRLAVALTRLGMIAIKRGRTQDAENRLRRALELRDSEASGDGVQLGALLVALAQVVSEQGGHDEARRLLERAVGLFESSPGARAGALRDLCAVLRLQGELADAKQRCEQALAAHQQAGAADDEAMLRLSTLLGEVLLARGELDRADTRLSDGLSLAEKRFGPGHPRAAPLLIAIAELRHKQGRTDEAVAMLDRVAALSATLGAAHHDVVTAVVRRAWLMIDAGDATEVVAAIREQQTKAGDDLAPQDRFELAFAEAAAQWGSGQREDAEATARRARQQYAKVDGARAEALARIDAWLADR